jgi:hypothetical protein
MLYRLVPKPDPLTLILADPAVKTFSLDKDETVAASNDIAWLTVPTPSPLVRLTRRLPSTPPPVRHRTELSDNHSVPSALVRPALPPPLYRAVPKLAPLSVRLTDPLVPPFASVTPDTEASSNESPLLTLPTTPPPVTDKTKLPFTPANALHNKELSDTHSVASAPVQPPRPFTL